MKVSAIQNTYGSPSGAAKQLSEPIFSLGAGYHRFFARPGATVLQNFVETGATVNPLQGKYVPLFRASKQILNNLVHQKLFNTEIIGVIIYFINTLQNTI